MIVTYLARLMLLLPDLSHADSTHLQDLVVFQSPTENGFEDREAKLRDLSGIIGSTPYEHLSLQVNELKCLLKCF
jgi:hypothetical protein